VWPGGIWAARGLLVCLPVIALTADLLVANVAFKPAHVHPHGEVLALDVRRGNLRLVRIAFNAALLGARALSRGILLFVALLARGTAIQLDKLGVVHIATKRAFNGFQIRLVAVCRKLDPGCARRRPLAASFTRLTFVNDSAPLAP
jgi:hypothetical protein